MPTARGGAPASGELGAQGERPWQVHTPHMETHACTRISVRAPPLTPICARTCTHPHTGIHAATHMHTCSSHMHTYMHRHTYTHLYRLSLYTHRHAHTLYMHTLHTYTHHTRAHHIHTHVHAPVHTLTPYTHTYPCTLHAHLTLLTYTQHTHAHHIHTHVHIHSIHIHMPTHANTHTYVHLPPRRPAVTRAAC